MFSVFKQVREKVYYVFHHNQPYYLIILFPIF
jgi:hypothetical protein